SPTSVIERMVSPHIHSFGQRNSGVFVPMTGLMRLPLERTLPVVGMVVAAAAVPVAIMRGFGRTMVMVPMTVHFGVVAVAGLAALAAALALTAAGVRRGDGRAVIVGAAFSG